MKTAGEFLSQPHNEFRHPVIEVNVKTHNTLTSEHVLQCLRPEDCCNYCECHPEETMSESQTSRIDTWRRDVNKERSVMVMTPTGKKKKKLLFLKYTAPGTPDTEPGFRRMTIPRHSRTSRSDTKGHQVKGQLRDDLDMASLSADVANVSLESTSLDDEDPDTLDGKSTTKPTRQSNKLVGPELVAADTESIKLTNRSRSNHLLNCFTIDDCMARYRMKLALGPGGVQAWNATKAGLVPSFPNPNNPMSDVTNNEKSACRKGKRTKQDEAKQAMKKGSSFESFFLQRGCERELNSQNEAVTKAMRTILSTKEVVNNDARTGLFKHGKLYREVSSRESKRFRRMNDTLHRWIDEEILEPRSRLGSNQSLRSHSSMPERTGRYNGPKSMESPMPHKKLVHPRLQAFSLSAKELHTTINLSPVPPGPLHGQPEGARRSDSFLEMLMEFDEERPREDTNSSKGDTPS